MIYVYVHSRFCSFYIPFSQIIKCFNFSMYFSTNELKIGKFWRISIY
nr:MAG TPA: hypothetical protein [Caudoviricetes sp.]DAQ09502.1 MAG TPA: hypothetical protein [Caudoviricetes sp.]